MFGNVHLVFGTILENLRKSSEGGRKSSENHQKRRHQRVCIIKRTLHGGLKIWILFSRGKNNILRTSAVLPLENKIHIFAPPCNILYLSLWAERTYFLQVLTITLQYAFSNGDDHCVKRTVKTLNVFSTKDFQNLNEVLNDVEPLCEARYARLLKCHDLNNWEKFLFRIWLLK